MAASWTQNYYHATWGTKTREPVFTPEIEERLHPFLGGTLKDLRCKPLAIGGYVEHVHVLFRFPSDVAIAAVMRDLKSRSTNWLRAEFPSLAGFEWQEGYGGFTVSTSGVAACERYIRGQRQRHGSEPFATEYVRLLRAHGYEVDEDTAFTA